jgi:small-conductance mechanosensitive channel
MNRSFAILLGALALGAAIFGASFFTARHTMAMCCEKPADDLNWLRLEFHLDDADMSRIREMHEGYQPKCAAMCAKIAAAKNELDKMVGSSTNLSFEAQAKLKEIADLRAQCQAQMLEHFVAVSQAMPPEQGRRYLAEMKKLTLGKHEEIERSMSVDPVHEHQH